MSAESKEFLVASLARRDWLMNGLLGPIVAPYNRHLRAQRYADNSIRTYLKSLAHFAYWGRTEGFGLSDIDEALIARFIRCHLPSCDCPAPCSCNLINVRPALKHLVVVLRLNSYACKKPLIATPMSLELNQFRQYLRDTCGFAETTIYYRVKHLSEFLEHRFGSGPVNIGCITPSDIESCVIDYAKRWRPASLGVIRGSLKSYLRFRALRGDQTRHLMAALPVLADWSQAKLPKALSEPQLARFVQAFDLNKPIGQRDYAIARCLIDLGLRGQEIAQLVLESVDWQDGILTVASSKVRRVLRLPLSWQTGEAIARYLRYGRPTTTSRALFVHHEAPVGAALHVAGIRSSMRYAFERCGLDDQFCGTHVLRHTVAIRLQRSGASLKEIADVLGHRSLESTTRYARVDLAGLRAAASPWPGSRS